MIDTVILSIPRANYKVFRTEMFQPNVKVLNERGFFLVKCINNPTAKDKELGIYKPKLTIVKRMTKNGIEIPLKIEFSAPKILYGNNLDETEEKDFNDVAKALSEKLYEMGVIVNVEAIKNADVSKFHPSKNILLKEYTAGFVIKELTKINLSKKLDLDEAHFRNTGESVQYYTNSYALTFYDKIKDLKKQTKRAIDKDQNFLQTSLFESLDKNNKEIIRMEARLTKKIKMNAVLVSLNYPKNPKFKDVFNKELCQKILIKCWRDFVADQNLFLFNLDNGPKSILIAILSSDKTIKGMKAVELVGLNLLCKDAGIRELRRILEDRINKRSWYRISDNIKKINKANTQQPCHSWVRQISTALEEFKPYKINAP